MRKLATVRFIENIEPIEGADQVVLCTFENIAWKVVIRKDDYKVGDKVVYCEIDSFIPESVAPFLVDPNKPKEYKGVVGTRLKTKKIRGVISQGLVLPLPAELVQCEEGEDVSEQLGIIKYEMEEVFTKIANGQCKGSFPSFIPRTDQERIQNIGDKTIKKLFEGKDQFEVTLKLDGSSITLFNKDGKVGVCSRNLELKIVKFPSSKFVIAMLHTGLDKVLKNIGRNIAIQGELMGEGVQGNREKLTGLHIFIFDIFDIDAQKYLLPAEREALVQDILNGVYGTVNTEKLHHVPVLAASTPLEFDSVDGWIDYVDNLKSISHPIAEGVVLKACDSDFSFKAISNKYLLKCEA